MLYGDIYDIQSRVRDEYPNHDIVYVKDGRYNVIEKRKFLRYEGDYQGRPLFSMCEVSDVVFSFNHIPDMRIIYKLREIDVWKHPRGLDGFLSDMDEEDKKEQEKRKKNKLEDWEYAARESHRSIVGEFDGMKNTLFGGV